MYTHTHTHHPRLLTCVCARTHTHTCIMRYVNKSLFVVLVWFDLVNTLADMLNSTAE